MDVLGLLKGHFCIVPIQSGGIAGDLPVVVLSPEGDNVPLRPLNAHSPHVNGSRKSSILVIPLMFCIL
jgi:hypothetical protein